MFDRMDERGIEGLPVRLVIALVVGVASLSVMMNTLSGLTTLGVSELNAQPEPEVIGATETDVTVRVVDAQGEPVANATVVAQGGTANLDDIRTATTGENGRGTLSLDPSLGPNQDEGTVTLDIKPPATGGYTDERRNTAVLVIAD